MSRAALTSALLGALACGCNLGVDIDDEGFTPSAEPEAEPDPGPGEPEPDADPRAGVFCTQQGMIDCQNDAAEGLWIFGSIQVNDDSTGCEDADARFDRTTGELIIEACDDDRCACRATNLGFRGEFRFPSNSTCDPDRCRLAGGVPGLKSQCEADIIQSQCVCTEEIEAFDASGPDCAVNRDQVVFDDVSLECCYDPEDDTLHVFIPPEEFFPRVHITFDRQ